jgi:hypothetical protein
MIRRSFSLFAVAVVYQAAGLAQQPPQAPLKLQVYQVSRADLSPPVRNIGPPKQPPVTQRRPLLRLGVHGSQTPVQDRVTQTTVRTASALSSPANFEV